MVNKKKVNKEGIAVAKKAEEIQLKKNYIKNLFNGRFFLARCNMIADQLVPGAQILENVDGCPKTKEYMLAEYGISRISAIDSFRAANFDKKDLFEKYKISEDELEQIEQRYFEGKIIDESEDEKLRVPKKAEFVDKSEN